MIFAVDTAAARRALGRGLLGCPEAGCGGRLRLWGAGRARRVREAAGRVVEVRPDRARCRACLVSHVVLPAWYVPRRAYGAEVVGSALVGKAAHGQGHRRIARERGLPLAARHRRAVLDRLRLADPDSQLPGSPLWHVINVITRGRLPAPALGHCPELTTAPHRTRHPRAARPAWPALRPPGASQGFP
jgi:Domain of unknown function (DUF6431)